MAFCEVLLLLALAAYSQAIPSYSVGHLAHGVPSHRGLVLSSHTLVSPAAHDHSYLGSKPGVHHGTYGSRLAYEPPSLHRYPMTVGVGSPGYVDPYNHHGHGSVGTHYAHSHHCSCHVGETCRKDSYGRSYCEPTDHYGTGSIHHGSLATHGYGAGHSPCMYLEYPTNCLRPRIPGAITRYTFQNGYCQQIVASNVASWCRPRGQANNIFRYKYECQKYCHV